MATSVAGPQAWAEILEMWHAVDVPEGQLLVQVTEEGAVMSPTPGVRHSRTTGRLGWVLADALGEHYFVHQTIGVGVLGKKGGAFVPDFLVVREEVAAEVVHPEDALLVIEVTSPGNKENDRVVKYHAYARGGVQQYLLVDPLDLRGPSVTLFTEPRGDTYGKARRFEYGDIVRLEHPVPIVIDTGRFPRGDTAD